MTILQIALILFLFHCALCAPGKPVRERQLSRRPWR